MTLRVGVIAWKELRQLARDRLTVALMVLLPLLQLVVLGGAINTDVRHIPTVILDQDHSAASRDLYRSLEATTFYDIAGHVESYEDIHRALRSGAAKAALVIPPRYGSNITLSRSTQLQLVVDGTDPQTVGSATNTAAALVAARSAELSVVPFGEHVSRPAAVISLETNTWYNADLRTAVFIIPGLIGVLLTMTMVMLTAVAIARERERGTLEQLIVSPVKNIELVVGKILPFIGVGYVQITVVLLAGRFLFDVPFLGSPLLLYCLSFVFIAANLAIGLLLSTIVKTQQQAMQMSFFLLLPNVLLSGFMFPYDGMARPFQLLAEALPLTHFLRIVRGITLKGSTFADLRVELVWLAALLGAFVLFGTLRFSKKIA